MMQPANLLLIMSDNHQRNCTGAYGHPVVQTPNIDCIAALGVRFANAYAASAVCCPARAAIATGRFPHQTGYWDNVMVYDGQVPSWHHRLRAAGHDVSSIGKLHYIGEGEDYGFTASSLAMHIVERRGALFGLLRATEEGERPRPTPRENYAKTGVGEADYVEYDRKITGAARDWLRKRSGWAGKPWALKVSYASPHPPFIVPQRLMDLYPPEDMPLPPAFREGERPAHPSVRHIARIHSFDHLADEDFVRRTVAGYCALITHLDEQVGDLLAALAEFGLSESTRVVYVSDHGEAAGHHGHFGKSLCYDHSVTVPLVACGPGIPAGRVVNDLVSHVDLFPTILEGLGVDACAADNDLPGSSLWRVHEGEVPARPVFCEYHGHGSSTGMFMLRCDNIKLIHHASMPSQLFDLDSDPNELNDLAPAPEYAETLAEMESRLHAMLDPAAVDRRAKRDQRAAIEKHGGVEAILQQGSYGFNPVPGKSAALSGFEGKP